MHHFCLINSKNNAKIKTFFLSTYVAGMLKAALLVGRDLAHIYLSG